MQKDAQNQYNILIFVIFSIRKGLGINDNLLKIEMVAKNKFERFVRQAVNHNTEL